ncbi:MAG: hypothetical protein V4541_06730 [Bacteroidota bacterium]
MKRIILCCFLAIGLSSCSINKQAQQIKALAACKYELLAINDITIAGTAIRKLAKEQTVSLVNLPALALGLLRQDVPLKATLAVEITNPSTVLASVNNFEYIILINRQEIVNGVVNQSVSVGAGETANVPIQLNANIYQLLSNGKILNDISTFLSSAAKGIPQKGLVTIKIKPTINVGGNLVKYPGYITIDKEVSSKILL